MFFPLDNATVSINGWVNWGQRDALYWDTINTNGNDEVSLAEGLVTQNKYKIPAVMRYEVFVNLDGVRYRGFADSNAHADKPRLAWGSLANKVHGHENTF